jgi:hypothetical protein
MTRTALVERVHTRLTSREAPGQSFGWAAIRIRIEGAGRGAAHSAAAWPPSPACSRPLLGTGVTVQVRRGRGISPAVEAAKHIAWAGLEAPAGTRWDSPGHGLRLGSWRRHGHRSGGLSLVGGHTQGEQATQRSGHRLVVLDGELLRVGQRFGPDPQTHPLPGQVSRCPTTCDSGGVGGPLTGLSTAY